MNSISYSYKQNIKHPFGCIKGLYLGNVNAVITDRKIVPVISGTSIYEAVVISTTDYYPFGMEMPEPRHHNYTSDSYRYGYNGMEMDDEVTNNSGTSYTTEFRQYDPRLGRWKSLDPLMHMFPWMSPYVAFNNNPIYFVDPLGLASEGVDGEPVVGQTCRDEEGNQLKYEGDGKWGDGPNQNNTVTIVGKGMTGPSPGEGAELAKDSYNSNSSKTLLRDRK